MIILNDIEVIEMGMTGKIKMGMVGGGPGAFIGEVHRKAARLDGKIEIVAGAFSSDPEKSRQAGEELGLDGSRVYGSYQEMATGEAKLPENQRIDFVSIVTPNYMHFPIAKLFLESDIHVVCDKPVTISLDEAKQLQKIVKQSGRLFALTHTYTGYPMVKLAKDMVRSGKIGDVIKVVVQYPQGWLANPIENEGAKQAEWRTDPKRSGAAGCMGDIGSHAANLAEYITGNDITEVCADLTSFVEGRALDDDGNCLIKFSSGAKGILFTSQVSIGEENNLAIWVYGRKGSLEWHQEDPNYLKVKMLDAPVAVWSRGNGYIETASPAAARATRLPFGHPEGFIEAFANIYCNFADHLKAIKTGETPNELIMDYPGIADGVCGMAFIEAVVGSSKTQNKWYKITF
jgi:predicted dehydrogenase